MWTFHLVFKQSKNESQYPVLWLKLSHLKQFNFSFFCLQTSLRPVIVYLARYLGNHFLQTNILWLSTSAILIIWTASSEFGTYRLCEQRRFRRACASAQSRQNLRCSLIQVVSQEEPSDRKPDPWPLWMAGHAQLKFVMTECSKTQIRLTGPIWCYSSKMKHYHMTIQSTPVACAVLTNQNG